MPQVVEVTCGGLPHLKCKRDHIKMRDCMDRRVTPPKRVTTPTWGPPPPCKQALNQFESLFYRCTNQESVNKLCITDHDSLTRFLKTKTVVLFVLPIARQQQDCQQLLRLIK